MAKPGKHTFPSIPLPDSRFMPGDAAAARRRTQVEMRAAKRAAAALKKQTAREMKEGTRQAKKNGKKLAALLMKAATERAAEHADYEKTGEVKPLLPIDRPPDPADWNAPAPRQVRLAAAIANAYYRPDDSKAVTILRIKRAIVDLSHVMALLDDLYPLD